MKFEVKSSYNLDLLCFFNALTGDPYYLKYYQEDYDVFYPQLSDNTKQIIKFIVDKNNATMLSPALTLCVSATQNFYERNLTELFNNEQEMKNNFSKYTYYSEDEWNLKYPVFKKIVPVINELEQLNFKSYWMDNKLPLINDKISELSNYLRKYDIGSMIGKLIDFNEDTCTLYLCSFTRPHGIKLCGTAFISDYSYKKETTISIAAHEMFHPPYEYDNVKEYVDILGSMNHVIKAFENQNPNSGYSTMKGFIEENIVEALGIYICYMLDIQKEPYEYFKNHDEGSHVISPDFFNYLLENSKPNNQSLDDYFKNFVDSYK